MLWTLRLGVSKMQEATIRLEGYTGICVACFESIYKEEPFRFRKAGRKFHKDCAEGKPRNFYVRLEKRLAI